MTRVIYTDGACKGNPGPGGWAWVEIEGSREVASGCGGASNTTNNKMELTAVIEALKRYRTDTVHIHTDSTYVSKGVSKWLEQWKKRGWLTVDKRPVANRELWEALDKVLVDREVRFTWVKGHDSVHGNELADIYAQEQAQIASLGAGSF